MDLRRSFAVTVGDETDPEVAECLHELDRLAARLRSLMDAGKCMYYDTTTEEIDPIRTITYETVYRFFRELGGPSNFSKRSATVMQVLFDMRTPADEHAIRFYCLDYHHAPGVCACPGVVWPARIGPKRLRYRSLTEVSVARLWLVDRDDLLALTDEQLAALDIHPSTRQHVTDFIHWLRANPDVR